MEKENTKEKRIRLLQNIALISAAFALMLCVLIIVNFIQSKRTDPLNSKAVITLLERLKSNPQDDQLRTEIRELDLIARKAYFTTQWQVRTGGILLFISILVIIICFQVIGLMKKKIPEKPGESSEGFFSERKISRQWIMVSGLIIVGIAFLLAFLSHQDLESRMNGTLVSGNSAEADARTGGKQLTTGLADTANTGVSPDSVSTSATASMEGFPTSQELRANFPGFRGFNGNGIVFQKNIPTSWDGKTGKNVLWKTPIPLPGYNSPIYWEGKIYLSGANEKKRAVYCIDAVSGKIDWTALVEKIAGSPAQAPKVNKETGFSAPTVTTDGRRVYAIFANGDLVALDLTGKQVWAKNMGLPKNHYGHSSSLITWHNTLIVQFDQSGNAFVAGLSGKTGEELWKTVRNVKVSWASPILINTGKRTEIILGADPYLAGYDPATGSELWKIDCLGGEVGPSPAYADGIVFSVNEYSKLAAIQLGETPKQLWEDTEYLSDVPSPVATDQYLFLSTSYGVLVCYNAKTGEKLWVQETGSNMYASPVLAEGKIYQLDSKGVMHIYSADKTYHPVSSPQLGEGSFCTPAFADGKIFIRGDKNLFCIGK